MKILLPTGIDLHPALPDDVEAVPYSPSEPLPAEHHDAEALVVWGNSREHLEQLARDLTGLTWVQALAAGPDAVLAAGFDDGAVVTSGRGLHDATVSEHALALSLALIRRLPQAREAQREHRWATEIGGVQPLRPSGQITTLIGARVLIWGFGSIGQRLAPLYRSLGATVTGVARSAGERAGFPVVAEEQIEAALATTDLLVMVLPSSPATDKALNAERLAALPEGALLVNVGRGTTVDEDALVEALRAGRLAGAGLDVTAVEPLPATSPVWDAPNLLLTPHAAGGRPVGADELISHNVAALLAGEPLRNVVGR
ncbi:phosphoglycerate dehydrogenase [Georgenia sp. SYP-B2076]|uniref:phosphoglycerate dehydrogenase n=1 Tax=Georgenia sp. SYP-B2076 TaxID=2495881 RepID=UPI000F8C3E92|nr:phosphoglycerate dehydrogenase [Georgenia sp. SYP-B2076]